MSAFDVWCLLTAFYVQVIDVDLTEKIFFWNIDGLRRTVTYWHLKAWLKCQSQRRQVYTILSRQSKFGLGRWTFSKPVIIEIQFIFFSYPAFRIPVSQSHVLLLLDWGVLGEKMQIINVRKGHTKTGEPSHDKQRIKKVGQTYCHCGHEQHCHLLRFGLLLWLTQLDTTSTLLNTWQSGPLCGCTCWHPLGNQTEEPNLQQESLQTNKHTQS